MEPLLSSGDRVLMGAGRFRAPLGILVDLGRHGAHSQAD